METSEWKKDTSPYIVFTCSKCGQYSYVKSTQKTKKCLRCNRTHQVKNITWGIIVKGMTAAVETVKEKQNKLAIKELGEQPDLHTSTDFSVASSIDEGVSRYRRSKVKNVQEGENYDEWFKEGLKQLSKLYKQIPDYLLKMMAEEKLIPSNEGELLIKKFVQLGILLPLKNNYFKIINPS
jgi:hypothetical protein